MNIKNINILIPMAGEGTRLASYNIPKPLVKVLGKTIIEHSIDTLGVTGKYFFVTRNYHNTIFNDQLSSKLTDCVKDCKEIKLNTPTRGAVETCIQARSYIDMEEPLIITNCDQYLDWCPKDFLEKSYGYDGAILVYDSRDPKNSFCQVDDQFNVKYIKEKDPISSTALVGVHYYSKSSLFFEAADQLINDFELNKRPECFISETYNYLIKNSNKIKAVPIKHNGYNSLGTVDDIKVFIGRSSEFLENKPSTIFIDIDGTIFKHPHRYSAINSTPDVNPGVKDKMDLWDSLNHKIILVSARKESARGMTELALRKNNIPYDDLILGVTGGDRYLINDKLTIDSPNRSRSINVLTDLGLGDVEI